MKSLKFLPIILATLITADYITAEGQIDKDVLNELRTNFSNIDTYELLFSEEELIEYCKDSVAQNRFARRMAYHKQRISERAAMVAKTDLILLEVLKSRIKSIAVSDDFSRASKNFLENQLKLFEINFEVDEQLISDLFDHNKRDKATKEVCDVGLAMYIIFIYNPSLYIKVLEEDKVINPSGKIYFPIKCTLKEYDRSIVLRKKMKTGLLAMLEPSKKDGLKKVYSDIKNCDVAGSYD